MQVHRTTDHGFDATGLLRVPHRRHRSVAHACADGIDANEDGLDRSERCSETAHDTLRSPGMPTLPPADEPGLGDFCDLHTAMSSGLQRLLKAAYDGGDSLLEDLVRRYVRAALVLRDLLLYATSLSKAYPSASLLHAVVLTASIRYAYAWAIDQIEYVGSAAGEDATDMRLSSASVEALAALGALVEAHASGATDGLTTLGRTLLAIDEAVYRLGVERYRIVNRAALAR